MLIKESIFFNKLPKLLLIAIIILAFFSVLFLKNWNKPIFISPKGNFFTQEITIKLRSYFLGTIHYTLDGSIPTASSPVFDKNLVIDESSLLRMAVFIGKVKVSNEQSQDFYINSNHSMPIVSLSLESNEVTDSYGNFLSSKEKHLLGQVRYYENNQELVFEHGVRIDLHGESLNAAPQKSFRLTMVDESGNKQGASYPFFGPEESTYFTSLVLRNDEAKYTHLREQVANQIVTEATNLDIQRGKPVVLYINGQYWGLYFLRERFDETYFAQKYSLKSDALGLVETSWGEDVKGDMVSVNKKSESDANKLNKLLKETSRCVKCVSYSVADEIVDMDNLSDYLLLEFYFANFDWPYNNYKVWRYQSEQLYLPESEFIKQLDGRFRWLFFDSDVSFGAGWATEEKMTNAAKGDPYAQLIDNAFPFRNIFYSPTFVSRYISKMEDLLVNQLDPENTDKIIDYWAEQIRPEMPAEIERWKKYNSNERTFAIRSMEEWENQVNLLKVYLRKRPEFFRDHTQEFFNKVKEM